MKNGVKILLLLLVLTGVTGAALLSIDNLNGKACPAVASIPVCYVVLAAYLLILIGVMRAGASGVLSRQPPGFLGSISLFSLFGLGWWIAFAIALVASFAEASSETPVCPQSTASTAEAASWLASVPRCYLSALLLLLILLFYWLLNRLNR